MTFAGLILGGLITVSCVAIIVATLAATLAWRVIAPSARSFTLDLGKNGIRVFTEHGEIEIGSFNYRSKAKRDNYDHLDKPKRRLTVGDDGELVESEYDDYSNDEDDYLTM